jgi:hypothetical protein
VWACLADGACWSDWVNGTFRIRGVDPAWPARGAELRHCWGVGPLTFADRTTVVRCVPYERLDLLARVRPLAVVQVWIAIAEPAEGATTVTISERVVAGFARFGGRLTAIYQRRRNAKSLAALAALARTREAS